LVSPFDVSPIQPKQLREAENLKPGLDMEKLLLERVMLRKELKMRSMQEKLLEQSHKLDSAEERLEEYESLPGFAQFKVLSNLARNIAHMSGSVGSRVQRGAAGSRERIVQIISFIIFSVPSNLLHLLPSRIQVGCVSLVQHLASWVGERAENYNNECREREEERVEKEERGGRRGQRRRRRSRS